MGHINIDIILGVNEIPSFGSEEVKSQETRLGGTGANIALYAAKLGTPVKLISRVSETFPTELLDNLSRSGVELILERDNKPGPFCYIVDTGEHQIAFMQQGPMNQPGKGYIIESEYCHFATSNPDWILTLMKNCRGKKVFDPGQEIKYRWKKGNLLQAVKMADILILNQSEFNYLEQLTDLSSKNVIVTLGKEGSRYNGKLIPSKSFSSKSTLGAGDVFRGGLYNALFNGYDIEKSLGHANDIAFKYIENGISADIFLK